MNKKSIALLISFIVLSLAMFPIVFAPPGGGGIIIITPPWPLQQSAPATFTISVNTAADPTYHPALLLVMTTACHAGLTGNITVTWSGDSISFAPTDFLLLTGNGKVPDASISNKQYERAALADHLYVSGESVYWAMKDFLIGTLTTTPKTFTVTLPSSAPRMTLYALGKSENPLPTKFDRWVPPTNPGFVVPELGPILLALASFSAFGLYAVKRRKVLR